MLRIDFGPHLFAADTQRRFEEYIDLYGGSAFAVIDYRYFGVTGYGADAVVLGVARTWKLGIVVESFAYLHMDTAVGALLEPFMRTTYLLTEHWTYSRDPRTKILGEKDVAGKLRTESGAPVQRFGAWLAAQPESKALDAALKLIDKYKKERDKEDKK